MKNQLHVLALIAMSATCALTALAQPTWDVGETVLNEYDLVSGVNIPWELTWGPDDMLWCTTREGDVLRIDPASGAYETVLSLNVNDSGVEPGLLGMALHPNFESEPLVYLAYTAQTFANGNHERLSVFYWDGTSLGNEQILHIVGAAGIHNGSRLLVLPDNTLLMSTGDMGDGGVSSQNDNSDNGKILRFNLDGSVPADNPDPSSYVYTKGHRNSQGLCVSPNGVIYSSEHGQYNSDEFNILEAGRNYGWPNVEGACDGVCDWCNAGAEESFCETNNVPEPLKTWSPCAAVNDIIYYDHPAIPEWQGSVLMAVLGGFSSPVGGRLEVLHMSEDGLTLEGSEMFFTEFNQRMRDVAVNPYTGAIYLALNGPSYTGNGPNLIKEFRPAATDGVTEWKDERGLDIYPNPAVDQVQFRVSEAWVGQTYQVMDLQGRVWAQGQLQSSQTMDVTSWPAATYLLHAQSEGVHMTRVLHVQ